MSYEFTKEHLFDALFCYCEIIKNVIDADI